ncbi:unnamed protein product, partial [Symbiodinium pilosum]
MPRHVSARAKCPGICFLCLAGKEGDTEAESTPFEEMHAGAKWKATIMQEAPWTDLPHVMQGLPWVPGEEASFLKTDLWHNWHNGIGKIWLACSFVMLATLNVLQGGSVDSKFEELTGEFLSWAQRAGISPYLRQLNRDTFSFQTNNSDPQGSWSKAAATTQLMLFLSSFCDDRVEGRTADPLLTAIAKGTKLMNIILSVLYGEGYWIPPSRAKQLGLMLRNFLMIYQECAYECLQRRLNRFILVPKIHMMAHPAEELIRDGER